MHRIYFEDIHTATEAYPYIDLQMENINYIAHFHEEIEIAYVREGELFAATETAQLKLAKGNICVFMPGEIHSFRSVSANHLYIMKILPSPSAAGINFAQMRLAEQPILPGHENYHALLSAVQSIAVEDTARAYGYEYAVNWHVNQFLATLLRGFEFTAVSLEERRQMERKAKLLHHVEEYISRRYAQPIALEDVAAHCGYSKYYFAHYFKEVSGISFLDYLTAYRIDAARSRMELTSENLTEIAYACGFGSARSFNRAFRRYYGTTPTAYRRQKKNKTEQGD